MPTQFEKLLIIGGPRNGDSITVLKNEPLIKFVLPTKQMLFTQNEYSGETVQSDYQIYEKREYIDANGVKKKFLILKSLSDQQATVELYLLGILDLDENFEPKLL